MRGRSPTRTRARRACESGRRSTPRRGPAERSEGHFLQPRWREAVRDFNPAGMMQFFPGGEPGLAARQPGIAGARKKLTTRGGGRLAPLPALRAIRSYCDGESVRLSPSVLRIRCLGTDPIAAAGRFQTCAFLQSSDAVRVRVPAARESCESTHHQQKNDKASDRHFEPPRSHEPGTIVVPIYQRTVLEIGSQSRLSCLTKPQVGSAGHWVRRPAEPNRRARKGRSWARGASRDRSSADDNHARISATGTK